MFKSIPKSSISKRFFNTYKQFNTDNNSYPVLSASLDSSADFILDNEDKIIVGGTTIYTKPTYKSIKHKYYSSNGNIFSQFGMMNNPRRNLDERKIANTIYFIALDRDSFGEEIKKGSVVLVDTDNNETYYDDGKGGLTKDTFDYNIRQIDLSINYALVGDAEESFVLTIQSLDFSTGEATVLVDGVESDPFAADFDFVSGIVSFAEPLSMDYTNNPYDQIEVKRYGNIFYDDGLIVMNNEQQFSNYTLSYKSTQKIYETEVLLNVDEGEYNFSQNPTAVKVNISGSYDFYTTSYKGSGTVTYLPGERDNRLNYKIVRYQGDTPTNQSEMTTVFSNTVLKSGYHKDTIMFGSLDQFTDWNESVSNIPHYFNTSTYLGWEGSGFIYAPEDGTYEFQIHSDDASDLIVSGSTVASHYGSHEFNTNLVNRITSSVDLTKGHHPFRARLQQETGSLGFAVAWKKPSDSNLSTIPNDYFASYNPIDTKTFETELTDKTRIVTINSITQKNDFIGSIGSTTGSFNDYELYRYTDPTGSYLTPYITTIGLYDDNDDCLVVAKLPKPIKSFPDLPVNFIVRFDT
jgi:hypothetical protein